ncbi:hypothetical protein M422DRAFT_56712 [Sphaerobolus stellatus SS14]|uniref:Uncharacterized protein n=1 Tax=Sphaerobolus stellatus (strain SS14) TaxID=990650 RepID=A0A0C9T4E7_SPHS4|nr:hypothetical protein M422DRAFT_56712 [Sphaerobolus stellatus SS14]
MTDNHVTSTPAPMDDIQGTVVLPPGLGPAEQPASAASPQPRMVGAHADDNKPAANEGSAQGLDTSMLSTPAHSDPSKEADENCAPSGAGKTTADPTEPGAPKGPEPEKIDGVIQWTWPPFVKTNRDNVWSVNPLGVNWLIERLPDYDKVEGPQGVPLLEYEKRLKDKRLKFKKKLADDYMAHFKKYDLKKLLPPNPSQKQLKAADNRVLKKINNLLRDRHKKPGDPLDMLDLLFRHVRKTTARDCWAKSDPTYN